MRTPSLNEKRTYAIQQALQQAHFRPPSRQRSDIRLNSKHDTRPKHLKTILCAINHNKNNSVSYAYSHTERAVEYLLLVIHCHFHTYNFMNVALVLEPPC